MENIYGIINQLYYKKLERLYSCRYSITNDILDVYLIDKDIEILLNENEKDNNNSYDSLMLSYY